MITEIKKIIEKANGKINSSKCREVYFKRNIPMLHKQIIEFAEENNLTYIRFNQKLWHYMHQIKNMPLCKNCQKNTVKFVNITIGYLNYCSTKCVSNSSVIREKKKASYIKNYGVDHIFKSNIIKESFLRIYNVDNPSKHDSVKSKIANTHRNKSKEEKDVANKKRECTTYKKYGVTHIMKLDSTKDAIEKTMLRKYNVKNPMQLQHVKDKAKETNKALYIKKIKNAGISFIRYDKDKLVILCDECKDQYKITPYLLYQRVFRYNITPCTFCNPIESKKSEYERELIDFIETITDHDIIKNTRNIIAPLELDLFLPDYNIAFEFNGLYWHNELYKDKNYHLYKKEQCIDKNINLIQIFEDEWKYKKEVVKSRIRNILNCVNQKIYARHTDIRIIDSKNAKIFMNKNHTQGSINASINIGLYHNNEIVSIMSFGKQRKALGQSSNKDVYEMLRFCNKININIPGGASKLFKFFIKNYKLKKIISYADRRWSNGELYKILGFDFIHNSPPNYWYVMNDTREHRFKYRKSELIKHGYDPNKTEHQIMLDRSIYRIYVCVSIKFIYENKTTK